MLKIKRCSNLKNRQRKWGKGVHFKNTGRKGKGAPWEIL